MVCAPIGSALRHERGHLLLALTQRDPVSLRHPFSDGVAQGGGQRSGDGLLRCQRSPNHPRRREGGLVQSAADHTDRVLVAGVQRGWQRSDGDRSSITQSGAIGRMPSSSPACSVSNRSRLIHVRVGRAPGVAAQPKQPRGVADFPSAIAFGPREQLGRNTRIAIRGAPASRGHDDECSLRVGLDAQLGVDTPKLEESSVVGQVRPRLSQRERLIVAEQIGV